ncbi:MAG: hypothetical protein IIA27_08095 [Gemmatimonadetes bacterium]|nr:hypothetical protein [Gemmatimonadota bacterium]
MRAILDPRLTIGESPMPYEDRVGKSKLSVVGDGFRFLRVILETGLTYRPLAVTARDTLNWHKTRPVERQATLRAGLAPEREVEILAEWHASLG